MRWFLILSIAVAMQVPFAAAAADEAGVASDAATPDGAFEADAGTTEDASLGDDAGVQDAAPAEAGSIPVPVACDGALCDTTNGATLGGSCSVVPGANGGAVEWASAAALLVCMLGLRRRRARTFRMAERAR